MRTPRCWQCAGTLYYKPEMGVKIDVYYGVKAKGPRLSSDEEVRLIAALAVTAEQEGLMKLVEAGTMLSRFPFGEDAVGGGLLFVQCVPVALGLADDATFH